MTKLQKCGTHHIPTDVKKRLINNTIKRWHLQVPDQLIAVENYVNTRYYNLMTPKQMLAYTFILKASEKSISRYGFGGSAVLHININAGKGY